MGDKIKNALGLGSSDPNGKNNELVIDKFEKGRKEISDAYAKKRSEITGAFKKKKANKLREEEDNRLRGFLKAQEIFVNEQDARIAMAKQLYEAAKTQNAGEEEKVALEKAYLKEIRIREKTEAIYNNKNNDKEFDVIGGYEKEKFILTDNFINLLPLEMSGESVDFPNSILFFGPIGNGKTSFASAFAHSANCLFEEAKPRGSGRGRAEREKSFYDDLIDKAETAQQNFLDKGVRTIILIDEIDRFTYEGSSVLPKLKKFLEHCSDDYHVSVFATTNNPLELDSAIRGPKRMPIK